jgi:hypothetical protein
VFTLQSLSRENPIILEGTDLPKIYGTTKQ